MSTDKSDIERSLLEDASTLLMFATTVAQHELIEEKAVSPPLQRPVSNGGSGTALGVQPMTNYSSVRSVHKRTHSVPLMTSPGPAAAILSTNNRENSRDEKAAIAAAALQAAAGVPFPPRHHDAPRVNPSAYISHNPYSGRTQSTPLQATLNDGSIAKAVELRQELRQRLHGLIVETAVSSGSSSPSDSTKRSDSKEKVASAVRAAPVLTNVSGSSSYGQTYVAEKSSAPQNLTPNVSGSIPGSVYGLSGPSIPDGFPRKSASEFAHTKVSDHTSIPVQAITVQNIAPNPSVALQTTLEATSHDSVLQAAIQQNVQKLTSQITSQDAPQGIPLDIPQSAAPNSHTQQHTSQNAPRGAPRVDITAYRVDPDAGTISCLCGFSHDDGFTIQCDSCNRWQHAICMGIATIEDAPDDYLCYVCDTTQYLNLDRERAIEFQQEFLNPRTKRKKSVSVSEDDEETKRRKVKEESVAPEVKPEAKKLYRPADDETGDESIQDLTADEYHQAVYYELKLDNEFKNREIKQYVVAQLPRLLVDESQAGFFSAREWENVDTPRLTVKPYAEHLKQKFSGISKLGLFTHGSVQKDHFVMECLGELDFKENYVLNSINQYRVWGTPKPKVIFHPALPVLIDTRFAGNTSRFIRRSCQPSCKLGTLAIGPERDVKFGIFTTKYLKSDLEITLPWEWDSQHPFAQPENTQLEGLSEPERVALIRSVENVMSLSECACGSSNDCLLYKVKKMASNLARNNSRGSKVKSRYEELMHKPENRQQHYIPLEQHRIARLKLIVAANAVDKAPVERPEDETPDLPDNAAMPAPELDLVPLETPAPEPILGIKNMPYKYQLMSKAHMRPFAAVAAVATIEEEDYLPVPVAIINNEAPALAIEVKAAGTPDRGAAELDAVLPKPVKKLSFADYKKKKVV
ncbi:hypothetical protein BABINDRAFT_160350 [Babjeviella inositovora NRRL Y-12698]|uniref:PHD-type domain-containing protein n=1 Tax=Babjeviella inositovora NRRL Y-12698 TaxID=984486 RepID=A0A1E3QTN4_9ASCO|nr:uncharacterized protein BABINDRAFT_160350 [Babjeviella inositovora NRRL Y-12698]ODQ80904.1 hypothetical protein BABINDRAFT_160350 [Babjeviella inositovora NRRL Y-12698]